MRNDGIAWIAISNFLASMNRDQPKHIHTANAVRDAWMYGWNAVTTMALFRAIDEVYNAIETLKEM